MGKAEEYGHTLHIDHIFLGYIARIKTIFNLNFEFQGATGKAADMDAIRKKMQSLKSETDGD